MRYPCTRVTLTVASLLMIAAVSAPTARADSEAPYQGEFPQAASKKGLQVEQVDDALALGVKHAAINVNLSALVCPDSGEGERCLAWADAERRFAFQRSYVESLDQQIKTLSDHGVLVYLILLTYESHDPGVNQLMLHPEFDPATPNHLGAFNTRSPEGRAWLSAAAGFMAQRWSRPDQANGRVVGYIVGNEVNSHWWWSNAGKISMEDFTQDYHEAVRLVHSAVRRQANWPRVYLSLEHHWAIRYPPGSPLQSFPAKPFVDHFAQLAREDPRGDFDWQLAFHPYPEALTDPKFWEDETALPHEQTPRITMKNLPVLTSYFCRTELLYQGKPRSIIFSEQGFHTPDGPQGEVVQAAAYCYAYKLIESLDGVDAFILHRHIDHPHEGGLHLGLRRRGAGAHGLGTKKRIYECFRLADTPEWESAFQFALPVVGLESWE